MLFPRHGSSCRPLAPRAAALLLAAAALLPACNGATDVFGDEGAAGSDASADAATDARDGSGGSAGDASDAARDADAGLDDVSADTGDDGAADATTDATSDTTLDTGACTPGAVRCSGARLETCSSDASGYALTETCATAALCDAGAAACTAPSCQVGQHRCSSALLQVCNADRTDWSLAEDCTGKTCDAAGAQCDVCAGGQDHRCTGATLEVCTSDGQGWSTQEVCTTAPLCNAAAGACTSAACLPDQHVCDAGKLMKCDGAQSGFNTLVSDCGAQSQICDAAGKQCDVCAAGALACADATHQSACSADGQALTSPACDAATPYCVGQGQCVACTTGSQCPAGANECVLPTCASNACGFANQANGTAISTQAAKDCAKVVCDGNGATTSVADPNDLPIDGNACTKDVCTGMTPSNPFEPVGTACGGTNVCDGAGACVPPTVTCGAFTDVVYHLAGTFAVTKTPLSAGNQTFTGMGANASTPAFQGAGDTTPFTHTPFTNGFARLRFTNDTAGKPAAGTVRLVEWYFPLEFTQTAGANLTSNVDHSVGLLAPGLSNCGGGDAACTNHAPTLQRACAANAQGSVSGTTLTWGACAPNPSNATSWNWASARAEAGVGCATGYTGWGNVKCNSSCTFVPASGLGDAYQAWNQQLQALTFSGTDYKTATFTMPAMQIPNGTGQSVTLLSITSSSVVTTQCGSTPGTDLVCNVQ